MAKRSHPDIFISYRVTDGAQQAAWLYDRLRQRFGADRVFRDVDSLPPGERYSGAIRDAAERCRVMAVVIDRNWLDARDVTGRRRLDDPQDWVRWEIRTALERAIPIIPVVIQPASLPPVDALPDDIRTFGDCSPQPLHGAGSDVEKVVARIRASGIRTRWSPLRRTIAALAAVLTVGAVTAAVLTGLATRPAPADTVLNDTDLNRVNVATVGRSPTALAVGTDAVWVANRDDDTVTRLDRATGETTDTIPVGNEPLAIALDPLGQVWVANNEDSTLARIDPRSRKAVQTLRVGAAPAALAVARGSLWVAETADGSIARIDPARRQVAERVPVGGNPISLATNGTMLWVGDIAAPAHTVHRIDLATNREVERFQPTGNVLGMAADETSVWISHPTDDGSDESIGRYPVGAGATGERRDAATLPYGITIDRDTVWVASYGADIVARYDAATGSRTAAVAVGRGPTTPVVAGNQVWVPNAKDGTVSWFTASEVVSLSSYDAVDSAPGSLLRSRVAADPSGLAGGFGAIWVSDRATRTVLRVEASSGRVASRIPVDGPPGALTVDGDSLWVLRGGPSRVSRIDPRTERITVDHPIPDGVTAIAMYAGSLWLASPGDRAVLRLDVSTGRIAARFPIDAAPNALHACRSRMWVAGDSRSWSIDPASGEVARGSADGDLLGCDPAGAWVGHRTNRVVSRLDPGSAAVPGSRPSTHELTALAGGMEGLWLATAAGELHVVSTPDLHPLGRFTVGQLRQVIYDGGAVWATTQAGELIRIRVRPVAPPTSHPSSPGR